MRKSRDKEGYIAKLEDVEAVKKRVDKLEEIVGKLQKKIEILQDKVAKMPKIVEKRQTRKGS